MIVISVFREIALMDPDNDSHCDNPFDGVDIVKMIPESDGLWEAQALAEQFVEDWMQVHPGDKICIDSHAVTM